MLEIRYKDLLLFEMYVLICSFDGLLLNAYGVVQLLSLAQGSGMRGPSPDFRAMYILCAAGRRMEHVLKSVWVQPGQRRLGPFACGRREEKENGKCFLGDNGHLLRVTLKGQTGMCQADHCRKAPPGRWPVEEISSLPLGGKALRDVWCTLGKVGKGGRFFLVPVLCFWY